MRYAHRITAILLSTLTFAIGTTPALAHGDASHFDSVKGRHGGQLGVAGVYGFELTIEKDAKSAVDNPVVVYVTNHDGQAVSTTGATGTATLLSGKEKTVVTLTPDGDNRLKGMGKYASNPTLKAIVAITLSGKAMEQARFTPLAAPADGHTDHKH
jgi:hypothetical protein